MNAPEPATTGPAMTSATGVIVCPVCKQSFRYYTGTWIIETPNVTYCSKRCALNDRNIDGDDA